MACKKKKKSEFILDPLTTIGGKCKHSDCLQSMSGCFFFVWVAFVWVGHTDVSMLLYGYKILLSYHTKQHIYFDKNKNKKKSLTIYSMGFLVNQGAQLKCIYLLQLEQQFNSTGKGVDTLDFMFQLVLIICRHSWILRRQACDISNYLST